MLVNKRIDGQDFNIRIEGEGDPLLLVHGFPLDHSMWKYQLEAFAQTYRVIALT